MSPIFTEDAEELRICLTPRKLVRQSVPTGIPSPSTQRCVLSPCPLDLVRPTCHHLDLTLRLEDVNHSFMAVIFTLSINSSYYESSLHHLNMIELSQDARGMVTGSVTLRIV